MIFNGKVALVTGAARNVGKAIALRLAKEGARVIACDVDRRALDELVAEAAGFGLSLLPFAVDITDSRAVSDMFDAVEKEHSRLDILVNNAVVHVNMGERGPFLRVTADGWSAFLSKNLDALFFLTHRAVRLMARSRSGSIINISSNGAAAAHRQRIPYDTLKGALEAFTRALAVDLAPWNVRVNALRPCAVADEAPAGSEKDALHRRLGAMIPLGRIARPADVAGACVYLASDDAAFVTGQVWNIDGGMLEQSRPPQLELEPVIGPDEIEA